MAALDLDRTAHEHAAALRSSEYTARALAEATLVRVRAQEPSLNAYITVTDELALRQADAADAALKAGGAGPLTGIPVGVKDLLGTKGVRTTAASKMLETFVPPYDCTVVQRLNAAGAVTIGKTNLDEFAMGSSTEHSAFGPTRNPWDLDRVPGGSSGGSAATVAARGVPISLGTDTGGSIRQPAALCGILGLKTTYGRVSRWGVVAFASSLDQVGPFARDAEDAAALLGVIAGHDPLDATSAPLPVPDYTERFARGLDGLRVGVPADFFGEGLEDGVREAMERSINVLAANGAVINRNITLPTAQAGLTVYYIIAPSEASANLARYDGVKYGYSYGDGRNAEEEMSETRGRGFGAEVKRRIMLGTYALSAGYYDAYYLKAQKVRTLIKREFDAALNEVDVILTPTSPNVAFRLAEKLDDPMAMYLNDLYTIPVNIAGNPGISLPCGFSDGLPVGMQLIGRMFEESTLLGAAHGWEQVTDWHRQAPPARG
ncbi:MAG: Asp-tRNA(Asn)/Glu-tRNA(Gln) amidotransferase subunit GatA [Chloroflexi bacterium]|nr:Asp-tRNA(Asn)/Glu-tRNA(Gln) amidotransferase subunit GatA [Chloroflexota bacterium]MDA1240178.1 Asp-tRNA(Asn)/Glu-tRNA(Gln) amidotransferase subunit GatA [Chloroflexota bacterium]MQC48283.1 Asp-tRNA(Asn)/Glu-tRNA(Gln) amidotransferase subunit GatA [Chloroflexota bacterium]